MPPDRTRRRPDSAPAADAGAASLVSEHIRRREPYVDTIDEARSSLRRRGWALIRGAPFLRGGLPDHGAALRLAGCFGEPSARDGGCALWPVRARTRDRSATFSVRAGAAAMHTDAQYHRRPEQVVCLFVVRPAADGGATVLLAAEDAEECLDRHPEGPAVRRALAQPRWTWSVPAAFRDAGNAACGPAPAAAVLPGDGTIRWRDDNLRSGHARAAAVFAACVAGARGKVVVDQRPGDVIVFDNRRVLHGRTGFADPRRLLLRTRLWT